MTTEDDDLVTLETTINRYVNDEKIYCLYYGHNENFSNQLCQINDNVINFSEIKSCLTFIQLHFKNKIFLIISDISILSQIKKFENLFIFIFKTNPYEHLFLNDSRIIGIYSDYDLLYSSIEEYMNLIDEQFHQWTFFHEDKSNNLSKQTNNFLWLQLLSDIVLSTSQMNNQQLNETINSYLNNLSLRNRINTALRRENTDQIYQLRYFLKDLIENLIYERQQMISQIETNNEKKLIVYRMMKLSKNQYEQMKIHENKFISMKGFLITNRLRSSMNYPKQNDYIIHVLFEITIDLENPMIIFADMTKFKNNLTEGDILFNIGTTFRIDNINEQMSIVQMTTVNDGEKIKQKYIEDTHRYIENLSISIIFGSLISDMNRWDQSIYYFKHLINDDIPWIEYSIAENYRWKANWFEAQNHYDRAYKQMMESEPIRIKDSAIVLYSIANMYCYRGEYDEAYEFIQRSIVIQKKYYSSNHPLIANSLAILSWIYGEQMKIDEALRFAQESLIIREKYYNNDHIEIASSLHLLAVWNRCQGNYEETSNYLQQTLKIYEKYYPFGHVLSSVSLMVMGIAAKNQEKYDTAMHSIQQSITILKKSYSSYNIYIAICLNCIASINCQQEKYSESLDLYKQGLIIQMKCYSGHHPYISATLTAIGNTLEKIKENNFDEALIFHQKALTMLKTFYPSYHGHIAQTMIIIGHNLKQQEKFDEALVTFKQALEIQENYFPSISIQISDTLNFIGGILYQMTKYDDAFEIFEKALHIRRELYKVENILIADILNGLANVRTEQERYDEAIDYHKQSLEIYKNYSTTKHADIPQKLINLGYLKYKQANFKDALIYFSEAVYILVEHYSSDYKNINNGLQWILVTSDEQGSYDYAVEQLDKCLKIREICLSFEQSMIISTLQKISRIQFNQNHYEISLAYEIQCYFINEKNLPPNHENIGDNLSNIGNCYEKLDKNYLAIEYYKRALYIYEQCLPEFDSKREEMETNIERLSQLQHILNYIL
ncbi:hypothetical protein I4U23_027242 [Adineta vaga]|nr:hypothetical protein I4U23_027242 [Adineta vaga]